MSEYKTWWAVVDDGVIPVTAIKADGGWLVKKGCFREFVEDAKHEKLSETKEGAEARLRMLNGG